MPVPLTCRFSSVFMVIIVSLAGAAFGQTSPADLQRELDAAHAKLDAARKAFRPKLDSIEKYQAAKKDVTAADAKMGEARQNKDANAFLKASAEKRKAETALRTVAKELEAADPQVQSVLARVAAAEAAAASYVRTREQAKAAEKEQQRKDRDARRAEYMAVVDDDHSKPSKTDAIPLHDDDANLVLVKAKPQDYANKPLVVCGAVSVSDVYPQRNRRAGGAVDVADVGRRIQAAILSADSFDKSSHYSFELRAITKDSKFYESCWLYQKRSMGDDVAKVLANAKQNSPDRDFLMRFKISASSNHIDREMFEVLDWQFLGKDGKWTPWHSEVTDN
jgi:hypothetical protein